MKNVVCDDCRDRVGEASIPKEEKRNWISLRNFN